MDFRITFYGVLRQRMGTSEEILHLELPGTVGDLRCRVAERFPSLSTGLASVAIAVNDEILPDSAPLTPGARIALLPPVSGG
jgi:molybdopterin converting factor small subunit